jgi:hypothetical protein
VALVDDFLPDYDFHEVHRRQITAPPAAALTAAKAATPGEMPLLRVLFALRSGPPLLIRGRGLPSAKDRSLAEQMIEFGFVPLVESERELVLGFVGQPWKLTGGSMPRLRSADEWRSFDEPGYVKAVMNFRATPSGAGSVLETETRIKATDPASRRRFRPYWLLIRPGSGAIRRIWLSAAKRRAQA